MMTICKAVASYTSTSVTPPDQVCREPTPY